MEFSEKDLKLTAQHQRILKLLFKFRFVSAQTLAIVMDIKRASVYEVLEVFVKQQLVIKVYSKEYRIRGKPAYYYLSKSGVTTVRKLMEVKESVVHALYKNDKASDEYIAHCLSLMGVYATLRKSLPKNTQLFTRSEINQFSQFPKNRPDLYIRTPDGDEAIVLLALEKTPYIIRKRLDEIITHSEDEGWTTDAYPHICFILKDDGAKNSFLYSARKKLDAMGMDDDDTPILATSLTVLKGDYDRIWAHALHPSKYRKLFD